MSLLTPESFSKAIEMTGDMSALRFIRQGNAILFALLSNLNHKQLVAHSDNPSYKPEDAGYLYFSAAMYSLDGLVEVAVDDNSPTLEVGDDQRERAITIEKVREIALQVPGTKVREKLK
jgi:hypothetical protein